MAIVGDSAPDPHMRQWTDWYRYDDAFDDFTRPTAQLLLSVIAPSERDVRGRWIVGQSTSDNLVETHKIYNKKGDSYQTTAYKAPDGSPTRPTAALTHNAGRMNYRPIWTDTIAPWLRVCQGGNGVLI